MRAEVVRRKLATIREAVERLRPRASIGDFDAFVADVENWLGRR